MSGRLSRRPKGRPLAQLASRVRNSLPPPPPAPAEALPERDGWTALPAEELPHATFWPAGLAVGVTFLLWGLIASPIVIGMGTVVFVWSLAGWIGDIRDEARRHH